MDLEALERILLAEEEQLSVSVGRIGRCLTVSPRWSSVGGNVVWCFCSFVCCLVSMLGWQVGCLFAVRGGSLSWTGRWKCRWKHGHFRGPFPGPFAGRCFSMWSWRKWSRQRKELQLEMRLARQAAKNLQRCRAKLIKARQPKVGSSLLAYNLCALLTRPSRKMEWWKPPFTRAQSFARLATWAVVQEALLPKHECVPIITWTRANLVFCTSCSWYFKVLMQQKPRLNEESLCGGSVWLRQTWVLLGGRGDREGGISFLQCDGAFQAAWLPANAAGPVHSVELVLKFCQHVLKTPQPSSGPAGWKGRWKVRACAEVNCAAATRFQTRQIGCSASDLNFGSPAQTRQWVLTRVLAAE